MKVKALVAFKSKLFGSCRKLVLIFRCRLKKPLFIRALQLRSCHRNHHTKATKHSGKHRFSALPSLFKSFGRTKKMDRVAELRRSASDAGRDRPLFSSPVMPAYVTANKRGPEQMSDIDGVEDACRSFENYLVEMIVEEGKVQDLMDVEELLYCWKNITCPVFKDLVCRFYGELCKDLFSAEEDNDINYPY